MPLAGGALSCRYAFDLASAATSVAVTSSNRCGAVARSSRTSVSQPAAYVCPYHALRQMLAAAGEVITLVGMQPAWAVGGPGNYSQSSNTLENT